MHWEILIIPLIALGVWILGTLFKSEDEKTKTGVRRPGNAAMPPARRPVTNLDQFLDDARRRREAQARAKTPLAPPPRPAPRPALREPPSRPVPPPPPSPRRVAPPPPPPRREAVPAAVPAARTEAVVDVVEVVSEASPAPTPPAAAAEPTAARSAQSSPIAQQVRSLLAQPQTAATALALREIFDRPLCQRRR
jgi:hypothetical protein